MRETSATCGSAGMKRVPIGWWQEPEAGQIAAPQKLGREPAAGCKVSTATFYIPTGPVAI